MMEEEIGVITVCMFITLFKKILMVMRVGTNVILMMTMILNVSLLIWNIGFYPSFNVCCYMYI